MKWMHIHHIVDSENDDLDNLSTLCVACHAVMHMGRSLRWGSIEIWKSPISQVEIVHYTRDRVQRGLTLAEINSSLNLKKPGRAPGSIKWANDLLIAMEEESRAELAEPLCAIFIKLQQWQIEA